MLAGQSKWMLSQFSSVQSLSHVWLFVTPWTAAHQASLSITNSQSLPKLMSIESVIPSDHLILGRPLLLLPSIFPSIRVFSNESALHIRWPKYWSFSFSISPSNEHPGLLSFRMDWLYLLAVQGTLKSLLQHHSSKASILQRSAFLSINTKGHGCEFQDLDNISHQDWSSSQLPSLPGVTPAFSFSLTHFPDKCPQMISYYFAMQQLSPLGCSMENYAMSFLIIMKFCHLK